MAKTLTKVQQWEAYAAEIAIENMELIIEKACDEQTIDRLKKRNTQLRAKIRQSQQA